MTVDDKRANRRQPVALRIKLKYTRVDHFISKFATNLSRGGMFLSTRSPKQVGTRLFFELRLADDSPVIEGTGVVRWIAEYDKERPDAPHGMGVEFEKLSEGSRLLIEAALEQRIARGDDVDRLPGQPREVALPAPAPSSAPAAEPAPAEPPRSRRESGGATRRAPRVTEMLNDPSSDVVGAGDRRIADAVRRARELARDLSKVTDDEELARLLDQDAVPRPSVDQASRELADRLGGSAVASQRFRAPEPPRPPAREAPTEIEIVEDEQARSATPPRAATIDAALHAIEEQAEREARELAEQRRAEEEARLAALDELREAALVPARPETEIPIDLDDSSVLELSDVDVEVDDEPPTTADDQADEPPRAARKK